MWVIKKYNRAMQRPEFREGPCIMLSDTCNPNKFILFCSGLGISFLTNNIPAILNYGYIINSFCTFDKC